MRPPLWETTATLPGWVGGAPLDRKSTRLNSSHTVISYAVFCLKKKMAEKAQHLRAPDVYPRVQLQDEGELATPGRYDYCANRGDLFMREVSHEQRDRDSARRQR